MASAVAAANDAAVWPEGNEASAGLMPTTSTSRSTKGRRRRKTGFITRCTRYVAERLASEVAMPARRPLGPPSHARPTPAMTQPSPSPASEIAPPHLSVTGECGRPWMAWNSSRSRVVGAGRTGLAAASTKSKRLPVGKAPASGVLHLT